MADIKKVNNNFFAEIKKGDHHFFIEDEGEMVGEIHFVSTGPNFVIDRTHASDKLRGQGAGEELVKRMVKYAREEKKKIIPTCPYAKAQIEKHREYRDVLAE